MISHVNKFIFVHINKTGGTSVEAVLKKYCDHRTTKHEMLCKILPSDGFSNPDKTSLRQHCKHDFNDYFKFTFVRNPWDRCLSGYFYSFKWHEMQNTTPPHNTFKEYLDLKLLYKNNLFTHTQLDWISTDNGTVKTDFIGRSENLQNDFNIVCDKIGIPREQLPHKNKTKHKHYTEYYDDETREIVAKRYARDIEYFGYEFGN